MIPVHKPEIGKEEEEEVLKVIRSGWISSASPAVREFEEKFSAYIGRKYGVATSNGTTALHLAVTALGIKEGDEVIVPDLTFISPVNVVLYNRAIPVIVDVEEENWGLDPEKIRKAITSKTKAILVVHLYGNPAKVSELKEIAEEKGIYLIEDCAEAQGAEHEGKKVGNFGDIACFSFYANKVITTGEGGMCLTDDEVLYEKMQILRDHGMTKEKKYWHEVVGYNYRMTGLQAALGLAQLKKIDKFIERKREIARLYQEFLKGIVTVQRDPPKGKSIFWLFSILTEKRDELADYLAKNGVETRKFFYPVHEMPPYVKFAKTSYPISKKLSRTGMNLPSYPSLSTDDKIYKWENKGVRERVTIMGVTKSEILLAKLNTFFQRVNPKNIFSSIYAYYRTYENYKDVLLNIVRGKYPFEARLRTGQIVKIDNHVSAYFFTVYFTKLQNPDFSSDVLEFIFDSRKVSFYGWKYGGIIDAFGRHDYDFLNVENKTVVDIGAFIGDTAVYFALKGAKRVIAFEPFPKFFYLAQKNVNVNNVNDKVILINAGCGYDGKIRVKEDSGSNAASVLINQEEGIEIHIYSLDTITSSFDVEDGSVLKIDCEGCEYELFKRATDNALKKFNQIQIEYHYGYKELENRLKRAEFKVRHSIPKIVQVNDGQIAGYIYAWR